MAMEVMLIVLARVKTGNKIKMVEAEGKAERRIMLVGAVAVSEAIIIGMITLDIQMQRAHQSGQILCAATLNKNKKATVGMAMDSNKREIGSDLTAQYFD